MGCLRSWHKLLFHVMSPSLVALHFIFQLISPAYTVSHKKGGSTFVIINLENLD